MPPPISSIAAPPDGAAVAPADLAATAVHIASQRVFGVVWLDRDLVARTRFGPLVEFIEIGVPAAESVPPLIGLEDEIRALVATPDRMFELPAVAVVRADGAAPRLNFTAFWLPAAERFLLLVYRSSSRSDIEVELTRQVRGRLIAEAQLQAKSRELEIANRDLEQYAAIISHDLKAPLRALRYLIDDAETALDGSEPDRAREVVGEIRVQSRRMSHMMSALLDYASAGRKTDTQALVDTRKLVEAIAASLPRSAGMEIEIAGDWPELETLEAPLDLVLRNLVDNALKHHDQARGAVRIEARDTGTRLEIRVSDDGPGIPPEARQAVFLPFRTLGGSGTGMGLALVKRTVEAVGGDIRVEDAPTAPRGTQFVLSWPRTLS